ncbi:MAG: DUF4381 domain-containing protein [Endozoicomonas sp. (ex Botrylloides leachii)]|nr:DUF4381 domain-containing protein [Endozoicomonas sp. (ex Botrylloides leachii)]
MDQQVILGQLRANHLPEAVGYWPLAIGWWVLAGCLLTFIILVFYFSLRYWRKNRYRYQGLKLAQKIYKSYEQHGNDRQYAHDCNRLLKKLALHVFIRQDIASLNGKDWLEFLYCSSGNEQFKQPAAAALGSSRFNPDEEPDVTQLHPLIISWIKKHHA